MPWHENFSLEVTWEAKRVVVPFAPIAQVLLLRYGFNDEALDHSAEAAIDLVALGSALARLFLEESAVVGLSCESPGLLAALLEERFSGGEQAS